MTCKALFGPLLAITLAATASHAAPIQTGDQHVVYTFAGTGKQMPFRLFVPSRYDPAHAYPLVVVLHGAGGDENRVFQESNLEEIAEQRGYILCAPLGYSRFGGYGNIYPVVVTRETAEAGKAFRNAANLTKPPGPARLPAGGRAMLPAAADDYAEQPASELFDAETGILSEAETMAALKFVRASYHIDSTRIYLMGNSMGGVGTLYLAAKYSNIWAAISPEGGPIAAWSYPFRRMRDAHIPVLFVHGALDEHSNPKWSRALVDQARLEKVDARLIIVPGGHHMTAWTLALPQIFDFFDRAVRPISAPN